MTDDTTGDTLTVETPLISVSGSGLARTMTVSCATSGATICYTTSGTAVATEYEGPISIAGFGVTGTVSAFAVVDGTTSEMSKETVAIGSVLSISGSLSTLAGSGSQGSANGTGTGAAFCYPRGLCADGTNLYVVDSSGYTIRTIVISTAAVTTIVGTDKGPGYHWGIAIDGISLCLVEERSPRTREME